MTTGRDGELAADAASPRFATPDKASKSGDVVFASSTDRRRAYWRMLFLDHGFFRYLYLNLHRVGENAYRSAQPAPRHVRRFKRMGVRTVINLRGGIDLPATRLEKEACAKAGLAYRETTLKSRDAPKAEAVEAAIRLLEEVEYPALWHCKAGADRAGLMSAIYLMAIEGKPAAEAKKALSLGYGHVRAGPTGMLDVFIEAFERAEAAAAARGETLRFRDWVRRDYDRLAVIRSFHASRWGVWLVDKLLRRE